MSTKLLLVIFEEHRVGFLTVFLLPLLWRIINHVKISVTAWFSDICCFADSFQKIIAFIYIGPTTAIWSCFRCYLLKTLGISGVSFLIYSESDSKSANLIRERSAEQSCALRSLQKDIIWFGNVPCSDDIVCHCSKSAHLLRESFQSDHIMHWESSKERPSSVVTLIGAFTCH